MEVITSSLITFPLFLLWVLLVSLFLYCTRELMSAINCLKWLCGQNNATERGLLWVYLIHKGPAPQGPCLPGDPHSLSLSFNPSAARSSNQSIPREINPEYSLEGLMLKLQYFGHLMRKANSLEKISWCWERLRAGGNTGWDDWMASLTQWTRVRKDSGR